MLVKSKIFSRTYFSPTYKQIFTNIHLNFCLHQHTENSSPTYFFSPTYFTNITSVKSWGWSVWSNSRKVVFLKKANNSQFYFELYFEFILEVELSWFKQRGTGLGTDIVKSNVKGVPVVFRSNFENPLLLNR